MTGLITVKEVCRLTGVSARTLHHYDKIGLLKPAGTSPSGYRLYDNSALEKLQMILLFRELEFSLKDIRRIINDDTFDRDEALTQQIELLSLKKERLEKIIALAHRIKRKGFDNMDFSVFDTKKIDDYAEEAKAKWQNTAAYDEFSKKTAGKSKEQQLNEGMDLMDIFAQFGQVMHLDPSCSEVQLLVEKLQNHITANFYTCTDKILAGLGLMYCSDSRFTENINKHAGEGCAEFVAQAISIYCG